jgi:hypothetical protein
MQIVIREQSGRKYIEMAVENIGDAPVVTLGYGDGEGDVALTRHNRFPGNWIAEVEWPEGVAVEDVKPRVYRDTSPPALIAA